MISERDIERWFESPHYRKKSDWICIDQPKVISEWQSKKMIGQLVMADSVQKLSWMKDGSILINTSRGPIVNEKALYLELKNKRLRAAFDVFWDEPYLGMLMEFYPDSFFMTPHVASTCQEFLVGCRNDLNQLIYDLKQGNYS